MIADDVILGNNVVIHQPDLVNLYGCTIGDGTKIGAFVEIQRDSVLTSTSLFISPRHKLKNGALMGH